MAKITYDALLDQYAKRTSKEEAQKLLNLSLMRLGLSPQGSYSTEQALQINALILADAAEELVNGYMGMLPALQHAMEAGVDLTPEDDEE
jgi:hypothetical protein